MNRFEKTFLQIATEVEVLGPSSFRHAQLGLFVPQLGHNALDEDGRSSGAGLHDLWRFIYLYYYLGDVVAATVLQSGFRLLEPVTEREDKEFVARLQEANCGTGYFEPGWQLQTAAADHLVVVKDGIMLKACHNEVRRANDLELGNLVSIRFPKDLRYVHAGCYMAIGNAGPCRREAGPMVRLYFTLDQPTHAPELLHTVADYFNAWNVSFQVKIINHPKRFARQDSFILFLYHSDWERYQAKLEAIHRDFENTFRNEFPRFAQPIGRGWSIAAEPIIASQVLSFGQHRSLLTAEGLMEAFERGQRSPGDRYEAISARYRREGLDIRYPYRNRDSVLVGGGTPIWSQSINSSQAQGWHEETAHRILPGPWSTRMCIRQGDQFCWIEQAHTKSLLRLVRTPERLDRCRSLTTCLGPWARPLIPQPVPPESFVYSGLPTDRLLFDHIFAADSYPETRSAWMATFVKLGSFLAHLHATPLDDDMRHLFRAFLNQEDTASGTGSAPKADEGFSAAYARLPLRSVPILVGWASEVQGSEEDIQPSLIHGRFSTASCAFDPERTEQLWVMGWLEVAIDDPLLDLAYLLGELAEAAVVIETRSAEAQSAIIAAAQAILTSYAAIRGRPFTAAEVVRLRAMTAVRVINHMAIRLWTSNQAVGIAELLSGVQAVLPTFIDTGLETLSGGL